MSRITVKAKFDAGTHPVHGVIIAGHEYAIEEHQFADQLFERPAPDWLAPWERPSAIATAPAEAGQKKRR